MSVENKAGESSLITKHRPETWEQVRGHTAIIRSLRDVVERRASHAFLFSGPAGLGKTTLGRLVAKYVGAKDSGVVEIDAATYTGVDDMRSLTQSLNYQQIDPSAVVVLLIDEAHRLSKQAFDSLLKSVEEPPAWAYWVFCSTEPARIPKTIRTRCAAYALDPLSPNTLFEFLDDVAYDEKLDVGADVLNVCAREAEGSPRQALINLSACAQCANADEAARLLRSAVAAPEAIQLAQALAQGEPWSKVRALLVRLEAAGVDPESIRHLVRSYMTKVMLGSDKEAVAAGATRIIDVFSMPFDRAEGFSPVALAVGRLFFAS